MKQILVFYLAFLITVTLLTETEAQLTRVQYILAIKWHYVKEKPNQTDHFNLVIYSADKVPIFQFTNFLLDV